MKRGVVGVAAASAIFSAPASGKTRRSTEFLGDARHNALRMLEEGKQIFRFDTFGDEQFWTGQLRLNEAVGTLSPRAALGLGLKVDSDSLPRPIIQAIRRGQINLDAPAVAAVEFELGRRRDRVFRFRRTMTIKRSRSDLHRMSFDRRRLGDREYRT